MLEEEVLVGMLAELAESVDVPEGGAVAALAAIRSGQPDAAPVSSFYEAKARRNKRIVSVVGVAAAVLIVLGVATVHGGSPSSKSTASSAAAGPAAAPAAGASAAADAPVTDGLEQKLVPQSGSAASGSTLPGLASPAPLPSVAAAGNSASSGAVSDAPVPSVDADRVIRTGDVNLQVATGTVSATVPRLEGAASGLGGFLEDSQTQQADPKAGGVPSASVTLRVPAAKFETLLARVQALGTVITSTTSGKDVTAQYVDLDARLKALMTSRETYLVILSKATTVNDTLAVQQRLDDLQQQIEQLQGQENELASQSDLGTLTVEVSEPAPVVAPAPKPVKPHVRSGLSAAWHTAGDRFRRGSEAVIASLGTIALLLIALGALTVAYRFGRRFYIRRSV